jgi:hypothetical protein
MKIAEPLGGGGGMDSDDRGGDELVEVQRAQLWSVNKGLTGYG